MSERWVRKLLKRMKRGRCGGGAWAAGTGLQSQAAGETQRQALTILKQPDWHDFGPTFAAEQLAKRHQIEVGNETVRGWMIEGRNVEEQVRARSRRCMFGGRGAAGSASWCSGTPPSTTGWKDGGRCAIWCG